MISFGTPMLAIPLSGDQHMNAKVVASAQVGAGVHLPKERATANAVRAAVACFRAHLLAVLLVQRDSLLVAPGGDVSRTCHGRVANAFSRLGPAQRSRPLGLTLLARAA